MTKLYRVRHEFVETIPENMEEGVVYVSIPFAMAAHRCCCGCGNEVFSPLAPHRWRVTYDGETISLADSIGNWSFACQSHYWITRNEVRWHGKWTKDQIAAGRARTRELIDGSLRPEKAPMHPTPIRRFSRAFGRLRRSE